MISEIKSVPKIIKYGYMFVVGLLAVAIFDGLNIDDDYFNVDFMWIHYLIIAAASVFGLYLIEKSGTGTGKSATEDIEDFLSK